MNWIKRIREYFQERRIRKRLKPGETYIVSKPEFVGSILKRQDLKCIPAKQEFDKDGNCLHTAKAWKVVQLTDGRMFNIKCCEHCNKEWSEELMEQLERERLERKGW